MNDVNNQIRVLAAEAALNVARSVAIEIAERLDTKLRKAYGEEQSPIKKKGVK